MPRPDARANPLDTLLESPVAFTSRVLANGTSTPVDTAAATCSALLRMVREGYSAEANINWIAIRGVGAACAETEAVAHALPASRSAVRSFGLTPAALDTLPAPLAVMFSRDDSVRAWAAERAGRPWRSIDPRATASVAPAEGGGIELRVSDGVAWNRVRIVARGDFTGEGLDDLLVETDGGAQRGSLATFGVHVLTRERGGERLRYVRRVW